MTDREARPLRRRFVCMFLLAAVSLPGSVALAGDALLVLIDRSPSMASANKWTFASQGIVQALDQDEFDALDLGLTSAPSGSVTGPACVFNFPVSCQAPAFPQEAIGPAGPESSVGAGKRRAIRDWMVANPPDGGAPDGFPLYNAVQGGISALRAWIGTGHRILIVVTDGGISCGQLSSRVGYPDCNGCDHEWESPKNIADLVAAAKADASQPIDTFVIGVPGADTFDPTGCNSPPYHMRLALSAIAFAGSPEHVPGNCTGRVFTQGGADPTVACHADLTSGFSAAAVAGTISQARQLVFDPIFKDGFDGPCRTEICDSADNDCDGVIDEDCAYCNPLVPTALCGPSSHCTPQPNGDSVCSQPAGTLTQGQLCTSLADCAGPFACLDTGSVQQCLLWCQYPSGSCPPPRSCIALSPPVFTGAVQWGVCF